MGACRMGRAVWLWSRSRVTSASWKQAAVQGALHHAAQARRSSSQLLLLPWPCAAFGLTVIEAMTCGLPTFATNHGGPSEIIKHKKSGALRGPRWAHGFHSQPPPAHALSRQARPALPSRCQQQFSARCCGSGTVFLQWRAFPLYPLSLPTTHTQGSTSTHTTAPPTPT